jgi:O-antigen/teichoic acid export membrane protein
MASKTKAIYHNLFASFSSFGFLIITGFVLLPYYFRYITTENYGIWLGGVSLISLLTIFEANLSLILTQQLSEKWLEKNIYKFSKYFSAAILFSIIVSILIIIISYFLKDTITSWISDKTEFQRLFSKSFFIYSISLSFTIIISYVGSISQVFLKTFWPPFFNIFSSICGVVYTVCYVPSQGVLAIAIGSFIKSGIYMLLISIYSIKLLKTENIFFNFEFKYLLSLLQTISLPFISKLGTTFSFNAQNFIIAYSVSAYSTTIFDITRKLPLVVQTVINLIAVSSFTSFTLYYSASKKNNSNHDYTKYFFSFIWTISIFSLVPIYVFGEEFISIWVGSDKFGGDTLLMLLCFAAISDQFRFMISQQYYALGKFKLTAILDFTYSILFLTLTLLLIPLFGINGIVLATIISSLLYLIISKIMEQKYNVNLINYILNKSILLDFILIFIMVSLTKFISNNYIEDNTPRILFNFSILCLLFAMIFYKYKKLFNFIVIKFIKNFLKKSKEQ